MSKKHKSAIASMLSQLKDNSSDLDSSVKQLKSIEVLNKPSKSGFLDKIDYYSTQKSQIIEIEPNQCVLWKLKDRHNVDLGDLEEFAKDIATNGQVVPGIVRISPSNQNQYEIIAGERRWRACAIAKIKFKAILEILSDKEAAIVQAAENLNRKDLSDYSKGINYHNLIEAGIFTQSELAKRLNISKASMSNLLSFSDLPDELLALISDLSKLSARTATEIRALYHKGDEYFAALKNVLPKLPISAGTNKLMQLINDELFGKNQTSLTKKIYSDKNELLFTINSNGKRVVGINFPLSLVSKIDEELLYAKIKNYLEELV